MVDVRMRLGTQLSLAFLCLAVLPLTGMTVYSYASSQRAYRGAVQAEGRRLAGEMSTRLGEAVDELSSRIGRMRRHPREGASSAFQQAREDALAAAQDVELRALLKVVLSMTRREEGLIPFAVDSERRVYAADPSELPALYGLKLAPAPAGASVAALDPDDWIVVAQKDQDSGVTVGVARPLEGALQEIRRTAVRNLGYGLAIGLVALLGIVPVSRQLTRNLATLTEGVERLGRGETGVQVPVPRGAEELGRLATTFNRMALDLRQQQDRLLEQARLRKELEISRRIQEELLPREAARLPFAEAAGLSIPAREVGGDFFNYFALSPQEAAILVGDVSGKGVPAAILMANLQATLTARLPLENDLARLAQRLDSDLGSAQAGASYLTLFIAVLDGRAGSLRYVSAGHNTQLLLRRAGGVTRLESTGRPLGLLPGGHYEERRLAVEGGDVLLLFTDGVLDAEDTQGEAFGMERLEALVAGCAGGAVAQVLARVEEALRNHRGPVEPGDDATIVAVQVSDLLS